jgi:hypothetical protein
MVKETSMEMTEMSQLRPSRPSPEPIELEEVGPSVAEALRSIYVRVWKPFASGGRMEWSAGDWETELLRPGVTATVQLASNMSSERPVRRVWVQTSSGDHPNAIANYKSKGFVVFQTQPKQAHGSRVASLARSISKPDCDRTQHLALALALSPLATAVEGRQLLGRRFLSLRPVQ